MAITLLYASLLTLWFLILSGRVILRRRGLGVSFGDGDDRALRRRIRAHANFAEYAPLGLVLLGLLEADGLSPAAVHALGLTLLIGRLLHGWAFSFTDLSARARVGGTALTLTALGAMVAVAVPRVLSGL